MRNRFLPIATLVLLATINLSAQSIIAPPSGDNQKASVSQNLGLIRVTIDYNSPKVHHPTTHEDRRGKIWGKLVPYGMAKGLGYGTCKECPWRAGANENTVFTTSHDIRIEGQPLAAGAYGLHMIPGETEWTIIFSKNSTSWGSFFYDPADDALRVKVKPAKSEYHEWLTYEFPERNDDHAVAALKWEELAVPFTISVENLPAVYLDQMRRELRNDRGFDWQNYDVAANYALKHKIALKEALDWATVASTTGFPGLANFRTLNTLADLQAANGLDADSRKSRERALNDPTASSLDVHQYARKLLSEGKKDEALAAWQLNARKHPNEWPVNVGLARGNSAVGKYSEALKYAKLALAQAPDDLNKKSLQDAIVKLQAGKDMN